MMKVHKEVALTVIALTACYLAIIAFVMWDINPGNWDEGWRAALIGCVGYTAIHLFHWKDMVKK